MASFTTGEWALSSIKIVRLDDTELELTDRPIPRMVSVKLAMSVAVTDESKRAAFEEAVSLVDGDENTAEGTYEWAADFLSVVFTPNHRLEYGTEYTVNVDTSRLPPLSLSRALSAGDMSFTTMAEKDINGDGFADVIVGAYGYDGSGTDKGRAYIYLGSATGISDCDLTPTSTCVPDTIITGENNDDMLGWSVSTTGDVNADGYEDVIIGVRGYPSGGYWGGQGRAYIFLGSASGIANCDLSAGCVADAAITGENAGDVLAFSVSITGDVNGDGYDDVIVGAQLYPGGVGKEGRAYVFLGSISGIADCDLEAGCVADATITGENASDWLGRFATTAGDINADGYGDVIVGADGYDGGGGSSTGRAYVFLGSASGIADCDLGAGCVADADITGEGQWDYLGRYISGAGDINADGYDDVIVGAHSFDGGGGTGCGRAYVFLGSASGISDCDLFAGCVADATITGENKDDYLGNPVSGAGDINADGYDDVIVGAYGYGDNNNGRAYVFLGGSTLSGNLGAADADTAMTGENNSDQLGYSVSSAGDLDADGYDDVIIGATGYPAVGWGGQGRAYIFMGSGASISDCDLGGVCTADTTLTGESIGDYFGMVQ